MGTTQSILHDLLQLLMEYGRLLVGAVITAFAIVFRDTIIGWLRSFVGAVKRIHEARGAIASDTPWLTSKPRIRSELKTSSIPIITIANLKGGVGKTTLAANLAGYFASRDSNRRNSKCRILVIDLDFQGSLSTMVLSDEQRVPSTGGLCRASRLIMGTLNAEALCDSPTAKDSDRIQGVAAFFDLARIETRTFMQWLIRDFKGDLRYVLRDLLLDTKVQDQFDVVVIDAPPRLTTATIQALCASTDLLIPTKLDALSGDAVGVFYQQLEELRGLWPTLRIVGVVGTMLTYDPAGARQMTEAERGGLQIIEKAVSAVYRDLNQNPPHNFVLPSQVFIPDSEQIRKYAGVGIAFLQFGSRVREKPIVDAFERLGAEVWERIQNEGSRPS